jgi:uncharacterized protein
MFREMKVSGIAIDPITNTPIMILREVGGEQAVPIWIGLLEATAIATELEKIQFSRPMTHDLLRNVLKEVGARVLKIEVIDLRENTFYALITMSLKEREFQVDARPSDAIALALRTDSPIFVHEMVIERSKNIDAGHRTEANNEEGKKWTDILERLSPDEFGKYKM